MTLRGNHVGSVARAIQTIVAKASVGADLAIGPARRPRLVSASATALVVRWPGAHTEARALFCDLLRTYTPRWLGPRWAVVA